MVQNNYSKSQIKKVLQPLMVCILCLIIPIFSQAQVTLTDLGTKVVLDNGIIKATMEKTSSKLLSVVYNGVSVLQSVGNHSGAYYSWNGATGFGAPGNCVYSIKQKNANLVDVSFKSTYSNVGMPMDVDVHYVLKTGDSELYLYNTIEHKSNYPAMDLGEYRIVIWLGPNPSNANEWLFDKTYHGDGVRDFQLPSIFDYSHAAATGITEIVKLTTGVRAGLYDSKYEYSTALWDHPAVGNASDKNHKGIFAIYPSLEFFNQGPMYHDLVNGGDVIHVYMNGDHYDGATINVPAGESYKKFFGPFALYLNNKADGTTAFADANAQQKTEAAAWPFTWLSYNADYPQANARGKASGTFKIVDPAKPTINGGGAWIGLTKIATTNTRNDFMFEANNYHYWVKTNSSGAFTIPNVRPGTYKLFAYRDGAVGQFEKTNVVVTAGGNTNLGTLTWNIPRTSGNLVWEIGVNNRSSKEFQFGSNKYFLGFTQELIKPNYTNPLQYNVADKNWGSKLNYAHIGYPNASGGNDSWRWNLNFNLSNVPSSGNAILTIAYASAGGASQGVFVNSATQFIRFFPPQGQGNAFVRQSNYGKYSFFKVSIPVSNFKNGANFIGLEISVNGHVMYDYISLEMPGVTANSILARVGNPETGNSNESLTEEVKTTVYPNPSNHAFTIQANGFFNYKIYNTNGQVMTDGAASERCSVGHDLSKGMYIIRVHNGIETKSFKVIKE